MVEQRKCPRVRLGREVLINSTISAQGIDISEGGLYVHTGRNFTLRSIVDIRFRILDKELNLRAQVKSCQQSVGMGLGFINAGEAEMSLIREFVAESGGGSVRKKVLLVDDNEASRRMNKSRLVLDGFTVMEAASDAEAIARLKAGYLDAVVLGFYLRNVDGYKVLAHMKADEALKKVPVLALSARGGEAERQQAKSAGAAGFLVKMTTSPIKLSEQLRKMLGMKL